jgi:hypothetical protein
VDVWFDATDATGGRNTYVIVASDTPSPMASLSAAAGDSRS